MIQNQRVRSVISKSRPVTVRPHNKTEAGAKSCIRYKRIRRQEQQSLHDARADGGPIDRHQRWVDYGSATPRFLNDQRDAPDRRLRRRPLAPARRPPAP